MFIDSRWKYCSFVANLLPTRFLNVCVLPAFENLSPFLEDLLEMLLGCNNIAADVLVTMANIEIMRILTFKTFEDESTTCLQNIGHRLLSYGAVYSRRTETSCGLYL